MEWRNPKDVMKIHKIQRLRSQNTGNSGKSVSSAQSASRRVELKRRQSAPPPPLHRDEVNKKSALLHSKSQSDNSLGLSLSSPRTRSKRRNPFGKEVPVTASQSVDLDLMPAKRRVTLDQIVTTPYDVATDICLNSCSSDDISSSNSGTSNQTLTLMKSPQKTNNDFEERAFNPLSSQIEDKESSENVVPIIHPTTTRQHHTTTQPDATVLPSQTEEAQSQRPPLDWSIKTKVRIVTDYDNEAMKRSPGIDARHLLCFTQHRFEDGKEWKDLDLMQKIRRCCMHYSYPQIPWIKTFPRLSKNFKQRPGSILLSDQETIDAYRMEWTQCFTSAYQQLRSGICPYFYLCCHQFTVLFRCQRSGDKASMSALLTPSTRGLRELLDKEGISFSLPNKQEEKLQKPDKKEKDKCEGSSESLKDGNESQVPSQRKHADDETENLTDEDNVKNTDDESDDNDDDHLGASRWLEGMGLDRKDFPSLAPAKVKLQREAFREIDNRPQSMLYVEASDVHPLFNFLLNHPGCFAHSGPQCGIPPTILSPLPFLGGTLTQNVVKSSAVREGLTTRDSNASVQVFEISGPLLPHHLLNISSILQHDKSASSSTVCCHTFTSSGAFNTSKTNDPEKDKLTESLKTLFVDVSEISKGLLADVKDRLISKPVLDSAAWIKELHVSASGFSWN